MCKVARIEWTYRTDRVEASDTASQVRIEVFRDGELLADLGDGPIAATPLERPAATTRMVTFARPSASNDAALDPAFADFSDGVRGHLDVRFRVDGPDAWQIRAIESTIVLAEQRPVLGALGSYEWREQRERFAFDGVGVISAEPSHETAILELSY